MCVRQNGRQMYWVLDGMDLICVDCQTEWKSYTLSIRREMEVICIECQTGWKSYALSVRRNGSYMYWVLDGMEVICIECQTEWKSYALNVRRKGSHIECQTEYLESYPNPIKLILSQLVLCLIKKYHLFWLSLCNSLVNVSFT